MAATSSLGHHDFFWFSKLLGSKDEHNHSHYVIMLLIILTFCVSPHIHTPTHFLLLPQPSGTYHRVLHSVNQLNDICSTTKVLQNLNLSFYLLFLHWLKYTRVIGSEIPFEVNK